MLNTPQKIPAPSATVVQEALNLISVLGSGNADPLLKEMLKVQQYNEKIFFDSATLKKVAEERDLKTRADYKGYFEKSEKFRLDVQEKEHQIDRLQESLLKKEQTLSSEYETKFEDIRIKIKKCNEYSENLNMRERQVDSYHKSLITQEKDLSKIFKDVREKEQKLDDVMSALKTIIMKDQTNEQK